MSYHNGPRIVTDGLVLCLDAANRKSYPGSGTIWTDLSNNSNATLTSPVTYDPNNKGSLIFNHSNPDPPFSYGIISNNNPYRFQYDTPFTISSWIKIDQEAYYYNIISHVVGFSYEMISYSFTIQTDNVSFYIINAMGGSVVLQSFFNASIGWNYVTVSFDYMNNNMKIYCNNKELPYNEENPFNLVEYIPYNLGSICSIGLMVDESGPLQQTDSVTMSVLQIYNRALLASEVSQNYNATKGRYAL